MSQANSDVVIDRGKSSWSDLWTKEDYWAIWIGVFILAVTLGSIWSNKSGLETKYNEYAAIIKAEKEKPIKTIEFFEATAKQKGLKGSSLDTVKSFIDTMKTPARWSDNPMDALILSKAAADKANEAVKPKVDAAAAAEKDALAAARVAQDAAAAASYADAALNAEAEKAIGEWQKAKKATADAKKKIKKPFNRIPGLIILGLVLGGLVTLGAAVMGYNPLKFFLGFLGVYVLCVLANIFGNQLTGRKYGLNAEVWSIILGLLIANTIRTPKWLEYSAQTEYYIKTGLVLLGAEVLFHKIMAIGIPGIFVAWVVTPIVLVVTYLYGQHILKIPSKTLNITVSADMSVCGTSAAIATAAACRAKKEELTLSIGLSMVFTAIMMIAMPAMIKALGLPGVLGGAWIGGTVDSTGAVAAAGAFLGNTAMQVAATVKMIQNVLIGVTAFFVALYWTTKVDVAEGEKVGLMEIWHRFPKFVIGFLGVSVFFSLLASNLGSFGAVIVDNGVLGVSKAGRGWFFALAFTSIGLTTDFRALAKYFKGGKPLFLYVAGQSFNIALTLLMAWIMFYKVFPEITAKI